jgi:hypothetical protein
MNSFSLGGFSTRLNLKKSSIPLGGFSTRLNRKKSSIPLKGQLFSMDFLAAVFIFLLVFGVLLVFWGSFIDNIAKYSERKEMELTVNFISNFLISTSGYPHNWEDDTAHVSTIGLASSDRVIDEKKLDAFVNMSYDDIRQKFMIGGYNFCFNLTRSGIEKCDFGSGDGMAAFTSRAVVYMGQPDILEIFLWRYV